MDSTGMAVTIESRGKEWMQAWMDKDEADFNDILAGDFLLSSARGVWMKKSQWIEGAIGPFTCADFNGKK